MLNSSTLAELNSAYGEISWILVSLWNHLDDDKADGPMRLQSFLGLYIFALLYELGLSYDALRRKNTIQLIGLCICNLGLLAYGFLQMQEIKDTISNFVTDKDLSNRLQKSLNIEIILVPVILGIGTVCMTFFTWKLRAEFSWSIYKNISADLQMKRRYFTYQVRCDDFRRTHLAVLTDWMSLGVYCSPEIRFLLRIWKSTPNSPCRLQSGGRRFYPQCCFDSDHNSNLDPVSSVLQTRETQISHDHDGEDFSA